MSISSVALKRWFASSDAFLHALGERPTPVAIRESLPWSLIGFGVCFAALLLLHIPHSGNELARRIAQIIIPSFTVMGVALVPILAWRLAAKIEMLPALFTATCVLAFALVAPRPFTPTVEYLRSFGTSALLIAILTVIMASGIIEICVRAIAHKTLAQLLGLALTIGVGLGLAALHISVPAAVIAMLSPLATLGDSYVALALIVVLECALWLIGVHGPALFAAIVTPLYLTLQAENSSAFAAHAPLPHIVTVSLFVFVFPGGAGATLPLSLLLAISRVGRLRTVGRVSLAPALFNINEPLLFGLPIVYNPVFAVPFLLAPLAIATITYLAVAYNLVGRPAFYVPSTVPTIVSSFIATVDLRAVALVFVNLAISTAIYYPFLRAYERRELAKS